MIPSNYYKNKTVLVTGGGNGIGKAICEELAKANAYLVVTDHNFASASNTLEEIQEKYAIDGQAFCLDVTSKVQAEDVVSQVIKIRPSIDIWINNAGVSLLCETHEMNQAKWNRIINTNFRGLVKCSLVAYQLMREQGKGSIVNVSSGTALMHYPSSAAYAASKAAVKVFTESLASEAKPYGIHVQGVYPGYVQTKIFCEENTVNADIDKILEKLPISMITTQEAASYVLKGIASRKRMVVFPFNTYLTWKLSELFPWAFRFITSKLIKDFRGARR